jgi:hypothetical protein
MTGACGPYNLGGSATKTFTFPTSTENMKPLQEYRGDSCDKMQASKHNCISWLCKTIKYKDIIHVYADLSYAASDLIHAKANGSNRSHL